MKYSYRVILNYKNEIYIQSLMQSCNSFTVQFSFNNLAKLGKGKFKIELLQFQDTPMAL